MKIGCPFAIFLNVTEAGAAPLEENFINIGCCFIPNKLAGVADFDNQP